MTIFFLIFSVLDKINLWQRVDIFIGWGLKNRHVKYYFVIEWNVGIITVHLTFNMIIFNINLLINLN